MGTTDKIKDKHGFNNAKKNEIKDATFRKKIIHC